MGLRGDNPNYIVPTATPGTNNNQAASTAFVQAAGLVGPPGPAGPSGPPGASQLFDTRAAAIAATIPGTVNFVRSSGYATIGDGGDALYKKAGGTTPGGFQSADGQWWQIVPGNALSVKAFGAVGDNTADDTAALQAWINAIQTAGVAGYLAPGLYKVTSALTAGVAASGPLTIAGAGIASSYIIRVGNGDTIQITGPATPRVNLKDFQMQVSGTPTAGAHLSFLGPSANIPSSILDNLYTFNGFTAIDSTSFSGVISRCTFSFLNSGFNAFNFGDSNITDSVFFGLSGTGIFLTGDPGGLKLSNCKFFCANGISIRADAPDGDILINGCSIESFTGAGISISNTSGIPFGSYTIVGNEIAGSGTGIIISAIGAQFSNISVTGNVIQGALGINIINCNQFTVCGNSVATGITVSASCTKGLVIGNVVAGSISNSSGTTTVVNNN